MRTIAMSIGAVMVAVLGFGAAAVTAAQGGQDKITICHAAGLAGTTQYVTLTISAAAVYGPAGHFYENGTPRAGHEDDYLGACEGDETTTDTTTTDETTTDETTTDETTTDETTTDTTTTDETTTDETTTDETTTDETTTTEETTTDETTTEATTTTETTTEQPSGDRCPPGMFPTAGKDGEPGNDECEYPPTPPTTVDTPSPPPVESSVVTPPVAPPVTPSVPAPPTVTPPVLTPPTVKSTVAKQPTVAKPVQREPDTALVRPEATAVASQSTLPFTGLPLWAYALTGVGMLGSGLALLRRV